MMRLENVQSYKLLPMFMRKDPFDLILTKGIDSIVKDFCERIKEKLTFWRAFDWMTEEQLDEAAEEMKVHWYRYDMNLEQKRQIIKNARRVKLRLGTPSVVEEVLGIYFREARMVEYWEYGGCRRHFKIQTFNSSTVDEDAEKFISVLDKIKIKSAVLDYVEVLDYSTNDILYVITQADASVANSRTIGGVMS